MQTTHHKSKESDKRIDMVKLPFELSGDFLGAICHLIAQMVKEKHWFDTTQGHFI